MAAPVTASTVNMVIHMKELLLFSTARYSNPEMEQVSPGKCHILQQNAEVAVFIHAERKGYKKGRRRSKLFLALVQNGNRHFHAFHLEIPDILHHTVEQGPLRSQGRFPPRP